MKKCLTRGGDGKDGLSRLGHIENALHDEEHDDGEQGGENSTQQIVRATILGHRHDLSNDEPNQVHPRNGRAKSKASNNKLGRLGGKLAGNLGHGTHLCTFW